MKKYLLLVVALLFAGSGVYAQKTIKIGDTEYVFNSPFKIVTVNSDTVKSQYYKDGKTYINEYNGKKKFKKSINEFFVGMSFMCPLGNERYQPIYYGSSYSLEFGWKYFYRPTKWYAIGTTLQYSFYSYKLKTNGRDVFDLGVATTAGNHYYRTDNIGTGIINRFYLFPHNRYSTRNTVFIEAGVWGDYSYSKRLKIKDSSTGSKNKYKYRDGSKFNPFEAGVQGGIGCGMFYVYAKYRLTDCFNHSEVNVDEVQRFSVGLQLLF